MFPVLPNLDEILKRQFAKTATGWKFGQRVLNGNQEFHNGIDLPAVEGTPVHSPFAGDVRSMFINGVGKQGTLNGNCIIMYHKESICRTCYCHMVRFADGVKVGSVVTAGQVIGYVGNTGKSFGAHLHFGTWQRDAGGNLVVVDPLPYLQTATLEKMSDSIPPIPVIQ